MTIDQARRLRILALWHRGMALAVCAWLLALATSGLLINHANDWGLDRRPLASDLQRMFYGFEPAGQNFCSRAAILGPDCAEIFARLSLPAGELLLSENTLFLLDGQGRLLEKLAGAHLGLGHIEAGMAEGSAVFLRDAGQVIRTDAELLNWDALDTEAAMKLEGRDWQIRDPASTTITWERMLLDLHAARFLGPLAKVFTDVMGGLVILLALSGLWLWWQKRRRG